MARKAAQEKPERQMKIVAIYVPVETEDRIKAAAEEERRPVSSLLRCLIEDWLDERSMAKSGR